MPGARASALAIAGGLAVVYVVWGSTYTGIAVALETMPPLLLAGARFLVAGALLYGLVAWLARDAVVRPTRRHWLAATLTGGPLLLVGNGGVVWAQQTVPSGVAALVIATVALWIVVLDRVVFGRRLTRLAAVGIVIGFAGVALLVDPSGAGAADPVGAAILALAALGWATGSLLARGAALPERPLVGAAMQMLAGGTVLTLVGIASGDLADVHPSGFSLRSLAGFAFLVVFGSIVAFTAYGWLLRTTRTSLVATYAYVNPVVAVLLGWAVLGETVTARTLVAGGIIVASVALIVSAPRPQAPEPARSSPRARARSAARSRAAAVIRGR